MVKEGKARYAVEMVPHLDDRYRVTVSRGEEYTGSFIIEAPVDAAIIASLLYRAVIELLQQGPVPVTVEEEDWPPS
jgi:hypothetical protein